MRLQNKKTTLQQQAKNETHLTQKFLEDHKDRKIIQAI